MAILMDMKGNLVMVRICISCSSLFLSLRVQTGPGLHFSSPIVLRKQITFPLIGPEDLSGLTLIDPAQSTMTLLEPITVRRDGRPQAEEGVSPSWTALDTKRGEAWVPHLRFLTQGLSGSQAVESDLL